MSEHPLYLDTPSVTFLHYTYHNVFALVPSSVWSNSDNLYDDVTYHWVGTPISLFGMINIDGKPYRYRTLTLAILYPQSEFVCCMYIYAMMQVHG